MALISDFTMTLAMTDGQGLGHRLSPSLWAMQSWESGTGVHEMEGRCVYSGSWGLCAPVSPHTTPIKLGNQTMWPALRHPEQIRVFL